MLHTTNDIHIRHVNNAYAEVCTDFHRIEQLNFCLYGPWRAWVESCCHDFASLLLKRHSTICASVLSLSDPLVAKTQYLRWLLSSGTEGSMLKTEAASMLIGQSEDQLLLGLVAGVLQGSPERIGRKLLKISSEPERRDEDEASTVLSTSTTILSAVPCEHFEGSCVLWAQCRIQIEPKDLAAIRAYLSYISDLLKHVQEAFRLTTAVTARLAEARARFFSDLECFFSFIEVASHGLHMELDGSPTDPFSLTTNESSLLVVPIQQEVIFQSMHFAPVVPKSEADEGRYAFETVIDVTDADPAKRLPRCFFCGPFAPQCCVGSFVGFGIVIKYLQQNTQAGNAALKRSREGTSLPSISFNGPVLILGMGGNVAANLLCEQLLAPTAEGDAFLAANPKFSIHVVELEPSVMATCAMNGLLPGYEHLANGEVGYVSVRNGSQFKVCLRSCLEPSWWVASTAADASKWRNTIRDRVHYHISVDALTITSSTFMADAAPSPLILFDCFDPVANSIAGPTKDVIARFAKWLAPDGILVVNSHFNWDEGGQGIGAASALSPFYACFPLPNQIHIWQFGNLAQYGVVACKVSDDVDVGSNFRCFTLTQFEIALRRMMSSPLWAKLVCGSDPPNKSRSKCSASTDSATIAVNKSESNDVMRFRCIGHVTEVAITEIEGDVRVVATDKDSIGSSLSVWTSTR